MGFWEAVFYGILGGITELLPFSFAGHAAVFQEAFRLSPLDQGGGAYVRAAISLGMIIAIFSVFSEDIFRSRSAISRARSSRRRVNQEDSIKLRTVLLCGFALLPMLISFFFLASAERMNRLPYVALFFALNGLLIYICSRGPAGRREDKDITIFDALLIGFLRMFSVYPGLSSVGTSVCVGRARGLSGHSNLRFTFLLSLVYQMIAFVYYLFRAFLYGSFSGRIILIFILTAAVAALVAYYALQYFRNLLEKNKLSFFAYYCWDAAVITVILAIING